VIEENSGEKILLFVHAKSFGYKLKGYLLSQGVRTEFHNASVGKKERNDIAEAFRADDGDLDVLIATSTLSQGVNLPASVVAICGTRRGMNLVKPAEIEQEIGRCGRIFAAKLEKYVLLHKDRPRRVVEEEYRKSIRGQVYIFVPKEDSQTYIGWLNDPKNYTVESVMDDVRALAFHIVAEMARDRVKSTPSLFDWYEKTFANFQGRGAAKIPKAVKRLEKIGAISVKGDELMLRNLGRVSSTFYYNPLDVYSLLVNLHRVFSMSYYDDAGLSWALSDLACNKNVLNREEKASVQDYLDAVTASGFEHFTAGSEKVGAILFYRMQGRGVGMLSSLEPVVVQDIGRFFNLIRGLVDKCTSWDRKDFFNELEARIVYRVSWEESRFCTVSGIGKALAKALVGLGYSTFGEVKADKRNAIANLPRIKKILEG